MVYEYVCKNDKCSVTTIKINKPMAESSKIEHCNGCHEQLERVYGVGAIVTGDGVKS